MIWFFGLPASNGIFCFRFAFCFLLLLLIPLFLPHISVLSTIRGIENCAFLFDLISDGGADGGVGLMAGMWMASRTGRVATLRMQVVVAAYMICV